MRDLYKTGLQKHSKLSGPLEAILFWALILTQDLCVMLSKSAQSVLWLVGVNKPCDRIYQSISLSLLVQGFLKEQFVSLANPKAFASAPTRFS